MGRPPRIFVAPCSLEPLVILRSKIARGAWFMGREREETPRPTLRFHAVATRCRMRWNDRRQVPNARRTGQPVPHLGSARVSRGPVAALALCPARDVLGRDDQSPGDSANPAP